MIRFILCIQICFSTVLIFGQNDTLFSYYPSGELMSAYPQKDSLNSGLCLRYYPSGEIQMESNWVDGKQLGKSYGYFVNGKLQSLIKYKKGIVVKSTLYYKNGNVQGLLKSKNDKIFSKGFYENGVKSFINKVNGKTLNCTYSLMPSGDNSAVCYYGDLLVIEKDNEYFDEDGVKLNLKFSSSLTEWYENGSLKSKNKSKHNRIGYYYEWDENGNLMIEIE